MSKQTMFSIDGAVFVLGVDQSMVSATKQWLRKNGFTFLNNMANIRATWLCHERELMPITITNCKNKAAWDFLMGKVDTAEVPTGPWFIQIETKQEIQLWESRLMDLRVEGKAVDCVDYVPHVGFVDTQYKGLFVGCGVGLSADNHVVVHYSAPPMGATVSEQPGLSHR